MRRSGNAGSRLGAGERGEGRIEKEGMNSPEIPIQQAMERAESWARLCKRMLVECEHCEGVREEGARERGSEGGKERGGEGAREGRRGRGGVQGCDDDMYILHKYAPFLRDPKPLTINPISLCTLTA